MRGTNQLSCKSLDVVILPLATAPQPSGMSRTSRTIAPSLSKQVLKGWVPADHTKLPRRRAVDAEWLGCPAHDLEDLTA
jgi:hypothetical protein